MAGQIRERRNITFPSRHAPLRPDTVMALADLQSLTSIMNEAAQQCGGVPLAKRPERSFHVKEFAKHCSISEQAAGDRLNKLVEGGSWERFKAYHPLNGRMVALWFYRQKVL